MGIGHYGRESIVYFCGSRWRCFCYASTARRNYMENIAKCPSSLEMAGKAAGCEGCPGQKMCQSQAGPDPAQRELAIRMKPIRHKILVMSGKGGVGKSTVSACLAAALSNHGNTAILDTDICGPSIPTLMAVAGDDICSTQWGWKPPVSALAGGVKVMSVGSMLASDATAVTLRGPRKTHLIKSMLKDTLWGRLDYLVIDTPPGTSDEHLSLARLLRDTEPDGVVLVSTPHKLALGVVRRQLTFCRRVGLPVLGLVVNMDGFICPCCEEVTSLRGGDGGDGDGFPEGQLLPGVETLGRIPFDPRLASCCDLGQQMCSEHPSSLVAQRVQHIVSRVISLCDNRSGGR